jgi:hypothetical protein
MRFTEDQFQLVGNAGRLEQSFLTNAESRNSEVAQFGSESPSFMQETMPVLE